jgi:poly(3-hydroxybutyrate) depolymerase
MGLFLYTAVEMARSTWVLPAKTGMEWASMGLRWSPGSMAFGAAELAALFDVGARLARRYEKPEWRNEQWGHAIELELLWSTPFGRLIRFASPDRESRPKLLIAAPLSGHYPTLLRETVKELSKTNDVYLTEWVNARDVPLSQGDFSLDDYVDFLRESLRVLHRRDDRPCHAMSVCQPTVPMLAAASLLAQDKELAAPSSLIMIGGPIDARKSPTATNSFAQKHSMDWFQEKLISVVPLPYAGAGRRVYPGFLQHMGFVAMNPSRHAQAHQRFFESLVKGDEAGADKHREFYDEYNAVMDLPAPYYLQTIQKIFKDFDLPQGRMQVCGRLVDPSAIASSLMTIEGELDDISGSGQTHSAQELCSSVAQNRREMFTAPGVGHYGVFSGSSFREVVAPRINAFIEKNAKRKTSSR